MTTASGRPERRRRGSCRARRSSAARCRGRRGAAAGRESRANDPWPYYWAIFVLVGQPTRGRGVREGTDQEPARADLLEIYQALDEYISVPVALIERSRLARLEAAFPDDTRVREQIAQALAEGTSRRRRHRLCEAGARPSRTSNARSSSPSKPPSSRSRRRAPEAIATSRGCSAAQPNSWLFKRMCAEIEEALRNDDLAGLANIMMAGFRRRRMTSRRWLDLTDPGQLGRRGRLARLVEKAVKWPGPDAT